MLNASHGWLSGLYPIPVASMMFVGFVAGIIRQRIFLNQSLSQNYRRFRRILFLCVIWPLCALGPYVGMKTYYYVQAVSVPLPPGWVRTSVQTTVLGWDNGSGFGIRIEGHGENKAIQFYRDHFEKDGWIGQSTGKPTFAGSKGVEFIYYRPQNKSGVRFGIADWGFGYVKEYGRKMGYPIEYKPGQKRIIYLYGH